MKNDAGRDNSHSMDRRSAIKKVGAFSAAAAVAGVTGTAVTSPATAASNGKSIILDVDTLGFADFEQVDNGGGSGPFYVFR